MHAGSNPGSHEGTDANPSPEGRTRSVAVGPGPGGGDPRSTSFPSGQYVDPSEGFRLDQCDRVGEGLIPRPAGGSEEGPRTGRRIEHRVAAGVGVDVQLDAVGGPMFRPSALPSGPAYDQKHPSASPIRPLKSKARHPAPGHGKVKLLA